MSDNDLREYAKAQRQSIMAGADSRLEAQHGGRDIVKFISGAVDALLIDLWQRVAGEVAPAVDVVAVGGYGRAELSPYSDWDLLFLVPAAGDKRVDSAIKTFNALVWDSGAHLGHVFRGMEIIGVVEVPAAGACQHRADRGLAAAGDAHHDDDHSLVFLPAARFFVPASTACPPKLLRSIASCFAA